MNAPTPNDDWKGELLIRSVPRRHELREKPIRICKAPGCSNVLGDRNVVGYCGEHRHLGRRYGIEPVEKPLDMRPANCRHRMMENGDSVPQRCAACGNVECPHMIAE